MSTEMILGVIGTLLGIANFVYWAWWAKRERVVVANSDVLPEFLPKGAHEVTPWGGEPVTLIKHSLSIWVYCELILINGEHEVEIRDVQIRFDKVNSEKAREYFRLPSLNGFLLYHVEPNTNKRVSRAMIQPKKAVPFEVPRLFECTDKFEEEYEKLDSGSCPEFIQTLLDKLETKYQICLTRYDGKKLCWRFPDKWYRNLGKKLWG
jgi:hypothetical protein